MCTGEWLWSVNCLTLCCSEQPWAGAADTEEDDPDGRGDRRRHGLPQRQQVRAQGPGCQELHGG